jgi:hypothetical protein
MGSFGDLLYDLSTSFGSGMEKGMAEQRGEALTQRKEKRAQGYQIEAEKRAQAGQIEDERRKRDVDLADWGSIHDLLAPIIEPMLPPTVTPAAEPQVAERPSGPQFEPAVTPTKISRETPLAGYTALAGLLKAQKPARGRGVTQVEMQGALTNPADPLHEYAKRYFYGEAGTAAAPGKGGYIDVQGQVAGQRVGGGIQATQALPPTATPADRKNILDAEAAILQGARVRERFKSDYVGIFAGGIKGRLGARLLGNTPEEAGFRASAKSLVSNLRRQFSGLAVTDSEVRNTLESMPDPDKVSPDTFLAILDENLQTLKERVGLHKGQFERPTSQPTTPGLGRSTTKYNSSGQRVK